MDIRLANWHDSFQLSLQILPKELAFDHNTRCQYQCKLSSFTSQSTFISIVLLANLVICHSLVGKISEENMFLFYFPKIFITLMVWITFYGYVFSEGMMILAQHLITNNYSPDSVGLKIIEVILPIKSQINIEFLLYNDHCLYYIRIVLWTLSH